AAFRDGHLGWTKVRSLTRVAQPANEGQWLEFALHHTAFKVEREVVRSPRRRQEKSAAPLGDRQIGVTFRFSPQQWETVEKAFNLKKTEMGRPVTREEVFVAFC